MCHPHGGDRNAAGIRVSTYHHTGGVYYGVLVPGWGWRGVGADSGIVLTALYGVNDELADLFRTGLLLYAKHENSHIQSRLFRCNGPNGRPASGS
ncbi:hypothetical protein MBAV_002191 [Candidatus Magnetobacterium bavaricum]|uniref:Uncharacterized protein n=1 Tax=Candidatus Magnetobacterium bavaricum TaxID=29290 RepID=A0A0F3GUR4_9BACT|nr:hypothetical protein MBAV_002191 [Candidatus Magnetobacterium bavaricum]